MQTRRPGGVVFKEPFIHTRSARLSCGAAKTDASRAIRHSRNNPRVILSGRERVFRRPTLETWDKKGGPPLPFPRRTPRTPTPNAATGRPLIPFRAVKRVYAALSHRLPLPPPRSQSSLLKGQPHTSRVHTRGIHPVWSPHSPGAKGEPPALLVRGKRRRRRRHHFCMRLAGARRPPPMDFPPLPPRAPSSLLAPPRPPPRLPICRSNAQGSALVNDALDGGGCICCASFERVPIIWKREIRNSIYSAALWNQFSTLFNPILLQPPGAREIRIGLFIIFTRNKD